MAQFVKLCSKQELPPAGEAAEIKLDHRTICVANAEGSISAMDNVCVHRGGPLGQGVVDGDKLICPWHGWSFNIKTGESAHNPVAKVNVYPLKIEGDDVLIEI